MGVRILIVEDEAALAEMLRYNLQAAGHEAVVAADGEEAELLLQEQAFDLVILDWMLPGVSGIELCRRMRVDPKLRRVPVLMLTARGEEADRVRGLSTGADDYVVKPFSVAELLARINAILRRARPERVAEVLSAGDIRLDRTARRAFRGRREMRLGPTEMRLLEFLLENAGRVLSRDLLLDRVWGMDAVVDRRAVDVCIGRVRRALTAGGEPDPIRTVRGEGYMLDVSGEAG
jgi:two-component system phosphate regulon response regulator PhoB